MIRQHDFNTRWWGAPVAARDSEFIGLESAERDRLLQPFAWAELSAPASRLPSAPGLAEAGLVYADSPIQFRIDLRRVASSSARSLAVDTAAESRWSLPRDGIAEFERERFHALPGATPARVARRYALWGRQLLSESPDTCLRIAREGATQGWFLARPSANGIELTLAMLASDATISGVILYQAAAHWFSSHGFALGHAGFSVRNTAVHNVYAHLGARFLEPREYWWWLPRRTTS